MRSLPPRMLGDGVAIDPTGDTLYAPCDARGDSDRAAHHAITLRTDAGGEILLHVGLDTVALAGEGFAMLGSRRAHGCAAGEAAAAVSTWTSSPARRRSLLTPVIIVARQRLSHHAAQRSTARCAAGRFPHGGCGLRGRRAAPPRRRRAAEQVRRA